MSPASGTKGLGCVDTIGHSNHVGYNEAPIHHEWEPNLPWSDSALRAKVSSAWDTANLQQKTFVNMNKKGQKPCSNPILLDVYHRNEYALVVQVAQKTHLLDEKNAGDNPTRWAMERKNPLVFVSSRYRATNQSRTSKKLRSYSVCAC